MKKIFLFILCVGILASLINVIFEGKKEDKEPQYSYSTQYNFSGNYNYEVPANAYNYSNQGSSNITPTNASLCLVCKGLGSCPTCDGIGRYTFMGNTSDCSSCKGSGDCWKRNGTGLK